MPSKKSKRQARITFTPMDSSAEAVQGYNKQIQELQSKLNDAESGSNQMHNEINRVMDERLNMR